MKINLELDPSIKSERNRLAKQARHDYESAYTDSGIEDASNKFPKFWMDELTVGKILGKGGFSTVYEVSAFDTSADTPSLHGTSPAEKEEGDHYRQRQYGYHYDVNRLESRQFISKHCLREQTKTKRGRYAVKVLSPEIVASPKAFPTASRDMAVETRILSSIEHPNIVKLRACSGEELFHEQYFIVMDRLYDTLERRLLKWRHRRTRLVGCAGWIINHDKDGTQKVDLWQEQIAAAYDLSSALAYLHKRRIVYRDLKPENIGFDIRDDIKLFDFGLATELRESYRDPSGLFHLTGMTGSPRYMAAEVANGQPYNATCDCYSFALLLWEILALKAPFGNDLTMAKLHLQVWTYPHERPDLLDYEDIWSEDIHSLLKDAWTEEVDKRISMDEISETLRVQVLKGLGGDGSTLEHARRRSTHIFRPTDLSKRRSVSSNGGSGSFLFAVFGLGRANNNNNKSQDSDDEDLSSHEMKQILSSSHEMTQRLSLATPAGQLKKRILTI